MSNTHVEAYVKEFTREKLESIAITALSVKYYVVQNILGYSVANIATTADRVTFETVWRNLKEIGTPTIELLLEELNDRGYYSEHITIDHIKLNLV